MENMDALLSKPETLEWVRQRVASTNLSRYQLARELCEKYQWRDVQGRFKEMACRKRLCQWHRRGLIVLPAKRRAIPWARPVADVDRAPIEATLAELGRIELILVSTDAERLRWRCATAPPHSITAPIPPRKVLGERRKPARRH